MSLVYKVKVFFVFDSPHVCLRQTSKFHHQVSFSKYRKIPKISPGAYSFQRPFFEEFFLEGLIFGGAYLWRAICVSKSSGLALQLEGNLSFLLCFTLYLRAISEYKPPGSLYMEGRFNGRFFVLQVWGAYIWRGSYMEGHIFGFLLYKVAKFYILNEFSMQSS